MSRLLRAAAALAAGLVVAGWLGTARAADADYPDSVDGALQVLRSPGGDERAAARRAADLLEAGTGQSQREILAELRADPPDVADARDRLAALSAAVHRPVFAPEPRRAQREVHDILAQPRYAALHEAPSLGDRIRDALLRLLLWVLDRIGGAVGSGLSWVVVVVAAAALAVVAFTVARSARWSARREAGVREALGGRLPARDRFVEADRLAAAGDLAGAVRELAGGVTAALGGDDRVWEVSPLTVRELFSRAPDQAALRPLLLAFETAVYGGRPPDAVAYRRAEVAAAPFRARRRAA